MTPEEETTQANGSPEKSKGESLAEILGLGSSSGVSEGGPKAPGLSAQARRDSVKRMMGAIKSDDADGFERALRDFLPFADDDED